MSYVPTLEKLRTIGWFLQATPRFVDTIEYEWLQDAVDAPGFQYRVFDHMDGRISLCEQGGWVEQGTDVSDGCLFYGTCPDEAFFNQLLIAVGWQ